MAKKKSQARQNKRAKKRQTKRASSRAVDHAREKAESQQAIRTLVIGALSIAIVIAFLTFKWDGKSAYDRLIGDESPAKGSASR